MNMREVAKKNLDKKEIFKVECEDKLFYLPLKEESYNPDRSFEVYFLLNKLFKKMSDPDYIRHLAKYFLDVRFEHDIKVESKASNSIFNRSKIREFSGLSIINGTIYFVTQGIDRLERYDTTYGSLEQFQDKDLFFELLKSFIAQHGQFRWALMQNIFKEELQYDFRIKKLDKSLCLQSLV